MSTTADVAVVGGGMAGASVAYELAATRSVVLLEAEAALDTHSTARSAATWIPGHGVAAVRALITASGPRFAALAAELGEPPLLAPRPVLWTASDAEGRRRSSLRSPSVPASRTRPRPSTRTRRDGSVRRCATSAPRH